MRSQIDGDVAVRRVLPSFKREIRELQTRKVDVRGNERGWPQLSFEQPRLTWVKKPVPANFSKLKTPKFCSVISRIRLKNSK